MKLVLKRICKDEIVHYVGEGLYIGSRQRIICFKQEAVHHHVVLPSEGWKNIGAFSRLGRRALRLGKCVVFPARAGYLIFHNRIVLLYDIDRNNLSKVLRIRCRHPLHIGVTETEQGEIFFGEYGNPDPNGKHIYRSQDGGQRWECVYSIKADKIRHIHACQWDPFDKCIWVCTGDFDGQCHLLRADPDFHTVDWIGDGGQAFRTCQLFFERDHIHWIMDSPIVPSRHIRMDRKSGHIEFGMRFAGPVEHSRKLVDGLFIASTLQEPGPAVTDNRVHVYVSHDADTWHDVYMFKHDGLPKRLFRFGSMAFANGPQTSKNFHASFESIKGLDGISALCAIEE